LRLDHLASWLEQGVDRGAPGPAEHVLRRVFGDSAWVTSVCEIEVCHGDLHMANALCREEPPGGRALLIDHHPTRMPWACEAAKPEILNAEPGRLGCRGLIAIQAAIRLRQGLNTPTGAELERLQAIVLGCRPSKCGRRLARRRSRIGALRAPGRPRMPRISLQRRQPRG
jgi:hypothetical protein